MRPPRGSSRGERNRPATPPRNADPDGADPDSGSSSGSRKAERVAEPTHPPPNSLEQTILRPMAVVSDQSPRASIH